MCIKFAKIQNINHNKFHTMIENVDIYLFYIIHVSVNKYLLY